MFEAGVFSKYGVAASDWPLVSGNGLNGIHFIDTKKSKSRPNPDPILDLNVGCRLYPALYMHSEYYFILEMYKLFRNSHFN